MDGDENLLVDSAQQFALKLGCENKVQVKRGRFNKFNNKTVLLV